tara:strand:+ start:107 stop:559 length:453 start_codon:yes stop_codon:yes gene_type:complete
MINNILLAIDLSQDSNKIFEYALDLKSKYNATLTVLNVNEELLSKDEMVMSRVKVDKVMKSNEEIALNAKDVFKQMLADFQIEDSSDIKMLLREGNASQEIIEYADVSECDIIILGSNSQSKISELLLGSTSKAVIKNSKIPVLVIPLVN